MKSELTLIELARELQRQADVKHDYLVKETAMEAATVLDDGGVQTVMLDIQGQGEHGITPHAHKQIATHLNIPGRYYERMRQQDPGLLCVNINRWLEKNTESTRLVRTLDHTVRGFLSNAYKPLDNFDFAQAALSTIHEIGGITVQASAITDTRMHIKAVSDRIQGEVRKGDIVQWGVALSNSEVGAGQLRIDPLIYRLVCTNGAVARQNVGAYSRRHVGRRLLSDLDAARVLSDEARQADDKAFWLAVRDVIRGVFNPDTFQQLLEVWQGAASRPIEAAIPSVVEVTLKRHKLPESFNTGILDALVRDGDMSQYGLGNAFTRYSQEMETFDAANDLEEIGADIMSMSGSEWGKLQELAVALAA